MDWLRRDLRVGLRRLLRDRAYTATVILTLALCIGANTALFAVVYNVLLRPLPVPEPDRVLLMSNLYPKAGVIDSSNSGVPDYYDRLRAVSVLPEQALFNHSSVAVGQDGVPTRVRVGNVTPSFFRVMPVRPALGRTFTEAEGEVGNDKKVVLSYALWRRNSAATRRRSARSCGSTASRTPSSASCRRSSRPWIPGRWRGGPSRSRPRTGPTSSVTRTTSGTSAGSSRARRSSRPSRRSTPSTPRTSSASLSSARSSERRLPHARRPPPGPPGAARPAHAVPAVGRRAVRPAHRLRERREPRARALARPAEGAGDAARTRRGPGAGRAPAGRGERRPDEPRRGAGAGPRGDRPADARHADLEDLPHGSGIRLDGAVVLFVVLLSAAIGFVLGLIPLASVLAANLTLVLREEGRSTSGAAAHGPCAARSSSRRWRSPSCSSPAPGSCSRASARCSTSIPASSPTGAHRFGLAARQPLRGRRRASRVHRRGAAAAARAAGRRAAGATDTIPFGDQTTTA